MTPILAVMADRNQAQAFLLELGFHGLRFKHEGDNIIKFYYSDYDKARVKVMLGEPKSVEKSIRYAYNKSGVVAIWPTTKTVLLKNTKKGSKPEVPEVKAPVEKPIEPPHDPRTGTENDDNNVPHISVDPKLEALFKRCQVFPELSLTFLKDLWIYLNVHKFQGKMHIPKLLRFMKNVRGTSLKTRGFWDGFYRELALSPRLLNHTFAFFVEVLLHEMCHQAVSEIDKVTDHSEGGHGHNWQAWMKKVGLNPRRYDPNERSTYMTEEEKIEYESRINKHKQALEQVEEHKLVRVQPHDSLLATVVWGGKLVDGMVACKAFGKKGWAFVSFTDAKKFIPGQSFNFMIVSDSSFYELRKQEGPTIHGIPVGLGDNVRLAAISIRSYYQKKKEARWDKAERKGYAWD